jgi:pimeloyl-ACP methyl ester carboxylesterase
MTTIHGFPFQDQTFVDIGTRKIPLRIAGAGKPLLFLHGFPLDSRMWSAATNELKTDFLCLAPDLRGFGAADEERKSFSVGDLARDCFDLLNAIDIRQPIAVCGLSMGGYVAMQFMNDFSNRVSHIVLTNTRANADDSVGIQTRIQVASKALSQGTTAAVGAMMTKLICPRTEAAKPKVVELVKEMLHSTRPSTIAWAQLAMSERPSFLERMKGWKIPALCIAGSEDAITPPAVVEAIHCAIPNSQYLQIAHSAHLSPMEQPEIFASELRAFVRGTSDLIGK